MTCGRIYIPTGESTIFHYGPSDQTGWNHRHCELEEGHDGLCGRYLLTPAEPPKLLATPETRDMKTREGTDGDK